ncbi:MAG: transketolase, partial [Muribaculaceae bacterium]|nr:transketolase [Muribaculaceae bacterium]
AWKMALENQSTPTALILSRQNINDLPAAGGNRYQAALGEEKGGYVVMSADKPEVILVANGSEVSLLCDVAVQLEAGQIPCRVVSVPSIGLFEEQPAEYRNEVITPGVKVFGLTAGLPSTLRGVVGANGKVFGLDHFGASAPYKVLDEKFGFTVQNITEQVLKFLGK